MFEAAAECLYLLGAEWRLLKPLDFLSVGVDHPEELSGSRHSTERESGFKKRSVSNREGSASALQTLLVFSEADSSRASHHAETGINKDCR